MLKSLMDSLQKELGFNPPIQPDVSGYYVLPFEGVSVTAYDMNPGIGLYCELATLPTAGEEAFLQNMMLANLFGQGTSGMVLGLTGDGKTLTLSTEMDYNIEYKDFKEVLEDLLNAADYWLSESTKPVQG